jgi:hypothetical protein
MGHLQDAFLLFGSLFFLGNFINIVIGWIR